MRFAMLSLCLILTAWVATPSQSCGTKCGVERWKVKTLSDTTVKNVDFDPVAKTVSWLDTREFPGTKNLPNNRRLPGIETMTFRVKGVVLRYKLEDDHDFHVVLADPKNHSRTIIVEFPNSECSGVCSSKHIEEIQQARADFVAKYGEPTKKFKTVKKPQIVEIVGVGFFDFPHGQSGRAPSNVELHPVISFKVVDL